MAFSPIILFLGVAFVCFYIVHLVFKLETKSHYRADRLDIPYKIIFSVTLIMLIVRSFLGDFMHVDPEHCGKWLLDGVYYLDEMPGSKQYFCHSTNLNVPYPIVIVAIISGFVTWFTPKIRDNDNPEF